MNIELWSQQPKHSYVHFLDAESLPSYGHDVLTHTYFYRQNVLQMRAENIVIGIHIMMLRK